MNAKYYELIRDRDLMNSFIDQRKREMGGKPLTHDQVVQIQNEFLEKCRQESAGFEETEPEAY
jgi:hypothetical protein